MMRRMVRSLAGLVMVVGFVAAMILAVETLAGTNRQNFNYTDNDNENSNWDRLDSRFYPIPQTYVLYCSQGANATTFFLASAAEPSLLVDNGARVLGDATCDGRGSATETTADMVISADFPVRVTGMACQVETTPGAASTYTLRNAAADLSPTLTCTIASGGPKTCYALYNTPVTIPGNTAVAVKNVTTTNESAVGALCKVFIQLP